MPCTLLSSCTEYLLWDLTCTLDVNTCTLPRLHALNVYFDKNTGFWLYGLRIYGLFDQFSLTWLMVNQILVLNFSDIWSFRLYGQLYQDKTVDHISETRCTDYFQTFKSGFALSTVHTQHIPFFSHHHCTLLCKVDWGYRFSIRAMMGLPSTLLFQGWLQIRYLSSV